MPGKYAQYNQMEVPENVPAFLRWSAGLSAAVFSPREVPILTTFAAPLSWFVPSFSPG